MNQNVNLELHKNCQVDFFKKFNKMQIKTTMRYHLTPDRMAIIKKSQTTNTGDGVEKREPSYTVGGNVNWHNHSGEQYGGSLKTENRITI